MDHPLRTNEFLCRPCFQLFFDVTNDGPMDYMDKREENTALPDADLRCKKCNFLLGRKRRRFVDPRTDSIICRACFVRIEGQKPIDAGEHATQGRRMKLWSDQGR